MKIINLALAGLTLFSALGASSVPASAEPKYGCFRVTAEALNIRQRHYNTSPVIGVAKKGDVLEKRKLWCTPGGYWCAVRTADGLEGYADKNYMDKVPCP